MTDIYKHHADLNIPHHGGAPVDSSVIDFSISVNPFPLPESVRRVFIEAWKNVGSYPDNCNTELTAAISDCYSLSPSSLLLTNGSAEAFSLIAGALLYSGKRALILTPCYSDYKHVSVLSGAEVIEYCMKAENGFEPDSEELVKLVSFQQPDVIWLCSPNNPTGVKLKPSLVKSIIQVSGKYGGFVILDKAYSSFLQEEQEFSGAKNLITVSSLTKDFGVPGIRLGYVNADPEIIRILNLYKPCWSVSSPAQAVGTALFQEIDYFSRCWSSIFDSQRNFIKELGLMGIDPLKNSSNECGIFVFFKSPELTGDRLFAVEMLNRGVRVRDCASMGAAGYIRAGVKLQDANKRFLIEAERVLNEYCR